MADRLRRTENIWLFGQLQDFNIYESTLALANSHFRQGPHGSVLQMQKNQIILHTTDGNGTAHQTIDGWNGDNVNFPSANFIVELARHRLNAAQPYSDVTEVVPSEQVSFHAQIMNNNSIGIEHTNITNVWESDRDLPSFVAPLNAADSSPRPAPHPTPAHPHPHVETRLRPGDYNRWYHVKRSGPHVIGDTYATNVSNLDFATDVKAFEEEQYLAMILLLRFLCIKHRIPRRFFGDTLAEKMQRWWNFHVPDPHHPGMPDPSHPDITTPETQSKLMRFRGILAHINCHKDKICGGPAVHRNRLFRGITDEWWMPVQLHAAERGYYTGPFDPPDSQTATPNDQSYVRWTTAGMQNELFHDIKLEALHETSSYFNLDHLPWYYASTERADLGGTFPIGTNKSWHGGVHLSPDPANLKVYAAASGTIVAARLGGNAVAESDPQWGSQRFLLIRHAVYLQTQANPGGGSRINYDHAPNPPNRLTPQNPKLIFTLYMHLARFPDPGAINIGNPLWFNSWLRHLAAGARPNVNAVFCPNVEVSVGDWLGECGTYHGKTMIHFEVMSKDKLTMAPWDRDDHSAEDGTDSAICNVATINQFVHARQGVDIDAVDMVAAAPQLRTVKSFHKSEWAMSNSDALRPALPGDNLKPIRDATWETRLKYFMWVADAVAACPDLSAQLCDAKGMTWHYHPIKFMEYVNKLVMEENGQVAESAATNIDTNVSLEDGYLTDFVHFAGTPPAAVTDNADGLMVKPFDVSVAAFTYHFTRADIACSAPTPHAPGPTPPQNTKFHLTMLDILENILFHFSGATTQGVQVLDAHGNPTNLGGLITVVRSHLCDGHKTDNAANRGLCVMGTARHLEKHSAGLAADIRPTAANPQDCQNLWNAARFAAGQLNASCTAHAGEASRSDLSASEGTLQQLGISTSPDAVQRKLTAGTALTPAEAAACILHLELTVETISSSWTCWVRRRTKATAVEVDMNFPSPSVMGTFSTQADAQAEMDPSSPAPSQDGGGWRVVIRPNTHASDARVQNGGIVGVYDQFADAENEKEGGSDEPWPEEGSAETN